MNPKARIYKDSGSWSVCISHPLMGGMEVFTQIATFRAAIEHVERYRGGFLSAMANHSGKGQARLRH